MWNVGGAGYRPIPEEYLEFARAKRRELLHHIYGLFGFAFALALAIPLACGQFSDIVFIQVLDAFAWVLAVGYTHIYAI